MAEIVDTHQFQVKGGADWGWGCCIIHSVCMGNNISTRACGAAQLSYSAIKFLRLAAAGTAPNGKELHQLQWMPLLSS
jgi:hypothetical protein